LLGGGRILQTGRPVEVYARPGSRTVGLHFGRPAMALIDGSGDGSEFAAAGGWLRVPCPHTGPLTCGVRPEDVAISQQPGFVRVGSGEVGRGRRVDSRVLVTVCGAGAEIRGFANEFPVEPRADVWLRVDRVHWFDRVTGDRVGT
jgi:ABC-type sugar transport system ATPase subunit